MNENKFIKPAFKPEGDINNIYLITSAESLKDAAKRDRYILLNSYDLQGLNIDSDNVADELEKEGFKRHNGLKDDVFYDPNYFEVKSVDVYKGLDKKYTDEGWKEVSRSGDTAILMKEK